MKKIQLFSVFMIALLLLTSCNQEKAIVGKWKTGIQTIEFTDSGEVKIFNISTSNYSFRNNKLIITTLGIEVEYAYEVKGDMLTLTDIGGNVTIYLREDG